MGQPGTLAAPPMTTATSSSILQALTKFYHFEGREGRTLHVWLYTDVRNSADILRQITSGSLNPELAFMDATLVPDLQIVHLAAFKALAAAARGRLTTRSLHAELVYNLSGSKHIAETLRRFGISSESKQLLVARFDATVSDIEAVEKLMQGTLTMLDQLPTLTSAALLTKYYKITPPELAVGSLTDAIMCRIAAQDC